MAVRKRYEAEKKLSSIQSKHEEEIRLRLDFELKINKLHNLTMSMKNHELTLTRKIDELEHNLAQTTLRASA